MDEKREQLKELQNWSFFPMCQAEDTHLGTMVGTPASMDTALTESNGNLLQVTDATETRIIKKVREATSCKRIG